MVELYLRGTLRKHVRNANKTLGEGSNKLEVRN